MSRLQTEKQFRAKVRNFYLFRLMGASCAISSLRKWIVELPILGLLPLQNEVYLAAMEADKSLQHLITLLRRFNPND
jgi:hypothetical protein